jgi:CRP/FNR family transcriptional regulator, cyclic AMP receptor protein
MAGALREAVVSYSGDIGYLASALVLAAFGMKDMVNLRIVAICSNIAFIAYALVLSLTPILVLHVVLLPLDGWRLTQALQDSPSSAPRRYS